MHRQCPAACLRNTSPVLFSLCPHTALHAGLLTPGVCVWIFAISKLAIGSEVEVIGVSSNSIQRNTVYLELILDYTVED